LFYEKDSLDSVYILLEGKVSIFKISENGERKVIFILNSGEVINDITFDSSKNSTVGCEAFENSIVAYYSIEEFLEIMQNDFQLTKDIISYMERRIRRLYRQLKNSISIKVDKKLAAKLYRLSREFGVCCGEWTLLNVNITVTYLADMLGCKRETVSRMIKVLQKEELIKIDNKGFYVKETELSRYFKNN
ncbi:TPA: Crp/Fnr family transcriptional regulator, partial [Clostridioides difficile]